MTKVNLGLAFLVIVIMMLVLLYVKIINNSNSFAEQLEVINSKLDHLEYDLHELEEK